MAKIKAMKLRLELYQNLVDALMALPSIGRKSAERIAYFLVIEDRLSAMGLSHAIEKAVQKSRNCVRCGGLSEDELCPICSDPLRERSKLCVVEHARDIFSLEASAQYEGLYYVIDSIENLDGEKLRRRIEDGVDEIIFAFSPSIASDALILYIEDKLQGCDVLCTRIAQGVPTGVRLENLDLLSLSKAMHDRIKL